MLISMRAGISVCVAVMMMVEAVFSGEQSLSVMEQECLRVGFWLAGGGIFDFGGNYVAVVVKTEVLDLVVRLNVRLVWTYLNGKVYCLWHFSLISLKANISNVRWSFFEIMMQTDFLSFLLFWVEIV